MLWDLMVTAYIFFLPLFSAADDLQAQLCSRACGNNKSGMFRRLPMLRINTIAGNNTIGAPKFTAPNIVMRYCVAVEPAHG